MVSVGGCRASFREKSDYSFEKNLDAIRNAALHLIEFNSKAIYCIAKPPIEAFVPLVSEVRQVFHYYERDSICTNYT